MKSHTLAAALLLSLPLVPAFLPEGVAHAQSADDALVKEARARFKEGVDLYDKGQYDAARIKFLQAYALRKHPAILLNMGLSCLKSGHPAEAARYLTQFQREATSATAQEHSDADKAITEARTKDSRIDISAPTGTEISADDTVIGTTPLADSIDLDPGQHTIKAKASDGTVDSRTVNTSVGQRLPVKFGTSNSTVVAPVPPPPVATSNPEVPPPDTTPTTPPENQQPQPPPPPPGKKTNFLAPPKTMVPVYIGAGVAGAGVVTAVLFGIFRGQAISSMNDAEAEITKGGGTKGICSSNKNADVVKYGAACDALQQDVDHANTDTTVANIGIGVAVIGVVGAAAWYLFAPKKDADDQPTTGLVTAPKAYKAKIDVVAPWAGYNSGGLSVVGSF